MPGWATSTLSRTLRPVAVPRPPCTRRVYSVAAAAGAALLHTALTQRTSARTSVSRGNAAQCLPSLAATSHQRRLTTDFGTTSHAPDGGAEDFAPTTTDAATLLDKVIALQADLGESSTLEMSKLERVRSRINGPARIAVLGDGPGRGELTSTLLESDFFTKQLDKQAGGISKVLTISYAQDNKVEADAGPLKKLSLDVSWLLQLQAEVVTAPASLCGTQEWEVEVETSDVVVLLLDALAPFKSAAELELAARFAPLAGRNLLVALDNADLVSAAALADATSDVRATLDEILGTETSRATEPPAVDAGQVDTNSPTAFSAAFGGIPIVPVSTRQAAVALQLPSAASSGDEFMRAWTASGVAGVKLAAFERLAARGREATKAAAACGVARRAAARAAADRGAAVAVFDAVRERVGTVLVPGLVRGQERLRAQFESRDVFAIHDAFSVLTGSARAYLGGVGFARLFLRSDYVAEDLGRLAEKFSISSAEWKIAYTIGALNEGLYTLYERTRSELSTLAPGSKHPLAAYSEGRGLQSDVAGLISAIDKQRPPAGIEVDPSELRRIVTSFDQTELARGLQAKADVLVRTFLAGEQTYDRDFSRVVASPLAGVVRALDAAVARHRDEAAAARDRAAALARAGARLLERLR
ncbi:hypothetical protein HK405_005620 [Cladochytrium tenue]|nr:hypothetical protein HK405_005620 [Cladochytrium tenue]